MEAFHLLGVRLRHLRRERPLKKVLITSTIPQEGKSMVAANLACTLGSKNSTEEAAARGRHKAAHAVTYLRVWKHPGICEWLLGGRSLRSSIYRLEGQGVWILPAGIALSDSLEHLQSGRLSAMMDQLTSWFDWIIIDSPPVLPLADTSVWTNLADGILLVTRQGTTEKRQLKRGLEALDPQKLIGATGEQFQQAWLIATTIIYLPTTTQASDARRCNPVRSRPANLDVAHSPDQWCAELPLRETIRNAQMLSASVRRNERDSELGNPVDRKER